ncbi:unnamed protein product [Arabidopsis halleri]
MGRKVEKAQAPRVLKQGDVLFGVLKEEQVGIHPLLGRPRIAPDVLEGMRQYLMVANVLRLEPAPLVSNDFGKGKGIVFGYESSGTSSKVASIPAATSPTSPVLGYVDSLDGSSQVPNSQPDGETLVDYSYSSSFSQPSPTAYVVGFSEAGTSGTKQRKTPRRKRPYISKRKPKPALGPLVMGGAVAEVSKGSGIQVGAMEKRKDDSLFIYKALEDQCAAFKEILDVYGRATGQIINLDKSSITFGSKISDLDKSLIKAKMGIINEGGAGTYLGLPEYFSGSKVDMLEYIHDRLKNRLSGWFARTLSQGGKEVLLKSVAMAMPVYAMSCFKLPKLTCESLSSAMSAFWWSTMEHHKKIHWVSWGKLCLPKDKGGLGFKDIELFNQALLGDRPSFTWRSIIHGRELLLKGLRQGIGDGASVNVWTTRWIQDDILRPPFMKNILVNLDLKLKDLIDPITNRWDDDCLQEHFFPRDQSIIRRIKPATSTQDFMVWIHNRSGLYSVHSGYWLASQNHNVDIMLEAAALPSINPIKDKIWAVLAPSKIKMFLWKAAKDKKLPIASRRSIPWIFWSLWKNRNNLLFEGKTFHPLVMVNKVLDDSEKWFLAQQVEKEDEVKTALVMAGRRKPWKPPDPSWLKCNIVASWDNHNRVGGAAWVLRNSRGIVLLHSRCSFAGMESKQDVEIECWLWALESLKNLKIRRVILAVEEKYLMDVVNPPSPSEASQNREPEKIQNVVVSSVGSNEEKKVGQDCRQPTRVTPPPEPSVQRSYPAKDKNRGSVKEKQNAKMLCSTDSITGSNRFDALLSCNAAMEGAMKLYSSPSLQISNCITIKLTEQNYIIWKSQFESFLRTQALLGHVNGSIRRPMEFIPVVNNEGLTEQIVNPDFQVWAKADQVVMSWLLGSMSEDVLRLVVDTISAQEVWLTLANHFNRVSSSRLFELQRRLENTSKLDKSMIEYLRGLKNICDQLASIGDPVSEKMKIFTTLRGLGREYEMAETMADKKMADKKTAVTMADKKMVVTMADKNTAVTIVGVGSRTSSPGPTKDCHVGRREAHKG